MRRQQPGRAAGAIRVLVLGGTTEARQLATGWADAIDVEVISSLAGVTGSPLLPTGEVRVGGFGGADRLAEYLRTDRISAVVDATHPFAEAITTAAVRAAGTAGVPLVVLRRPGWAERPGDDWRRVPSLEAAARLLPGLGRRVFLTTGRHSLAAFAGVAGCWFLSRSVEAPSPPMPREMDVFLARGPFTEHGERTLLTEHRINVLVTKDSGGSPAKLTAARELHIPVIMIERPPLPPGTPTVSTVGAARDWLTMSV
jgi:precorrin-6A/cobalt-precorrin-6A reductase